MFGLVGCTQPKDKPSDAETTTKYVDGTYVAYDDASDKSYGMVEVTIKEDIITDVKVAGFTNMGDEKGENYPWEAFHEAKETMPQRFIDANGTEVEGVTGATGSVTGWKLAVERALEKALVEPPSTSAYFNGRFHGASDSTEKGRSVAWVTIEDDKIVDVKLGATTFTKDEEKKEVFKDETYSYAEFHQAVEQMPQRFIEANGPEVDTFTGATGSSEQWKVAVERALEKATK